MRTARVLYTSFVNVTAQNGNLRRQQQLLWHLIDLYQGAVDILSLGSAPKDVRRWLSEVRIPARVLGGRYATLARLNTHVWYAANVVLCNKLRLGQSFSFPLRTPLPRRWIDRYETIVAFYAWPYHLLSLERARHKVIVDLNDVMADRYKRIGSRRWVSLSKSAEQSLVHSDARCIAISDGDRDEFRRMYGADTPVLPFLPADYAALSRVKRPPGPTVVGFMAARGYHNEEVLAQLADRSFLGALERGGATLVLAGGICDALSPAQRAAFAAGKVEIVGPVADAKAFYARIGIALNPVGPSTGMKVKSLEALIAGCKLITTPFGIDGQLKRAFGPNIFVLDWPVSPSTLAQSIISCLATDPASCGGLDSYVSYTLEAASRLLGPSFSRPTAL